MLAGNGDVGYWSVDSLDDGASGPSWLFNAAVASKLDFAEEAMFVSRGEDAVRIDVVPLELEAVETVVSVTEGRGAVPAIRLRLQQPPDETVVVNLARTAGDTDVSVVDTTVEFNAKNWRADQYIRLEAAPDADGADGQATITADGVGVNPLEITVNERDKDGPLGIELRSSEIDVREGRTAIFQVNLTADPGGPIAVTTQWTSGDADLSVEAHGTLPFDSDNWDRPQWVSIEAAADDDQADGSAQFTVSGPGMIDRAVTATEKDAGAPGSQVTYQVLVDDYVPIPLEGEFQEFDSYNRVRGDRGEVATGDGMVEFGRGYVRAEVGDDPGGGDAGAWHSLNHTASEEPPLNMQALLPPEIQPEFQYHVKEIWIDVEEGSGEFIVELNRAGESGPVFAYSKTLTGGPDPLQIPVGAGVGEADVLTWLVRGEGNVRVSRVGMTVEGPQLSPELERFLWPYAALLANYDAATGLTRDRAGFPSGAYDAINASGAQAAAAAVAAQLGIITPAAAEDIITWTRDALLNLLANDSVGGVLPHFVRSYFVVDNSAGEFEVVAGDWQSSSLLPHYHGPDYLTIDAGAPGDAVRWSFEITRGGQYEVFARWPVAPGHAQDAEFTVSYDGGSAPVVVDQRIGEDEWVSLGSYPYSPGVYTVTLRGEATGTVVADAIRLDGPYHIVPGTEYGIIDTLIGWAGVLLGSEALGLETEAVEQAIAGIDWAALTLPDTTISHGYNDQGELIPSGWDTFGGESLLVALFHGASTGRLPDIPLVDPWNPQTFNGSGFIDELLWLFVEPVDEDVWSVDWTGYRPDAAAAQVAYHDGYPVPAFGLSAGEPPIPSQFPADPERGVAIPYRAFGVGGMIDPDDGSDLYTAPVVLPHYPGMVASLEPDAVARMWDWMQSEQIVSPLNTVEALVVQQWGQNLETHYHGLKGSWNLGLWALGEAGGLLAGANPLHAASRSNAFVDAGRDLISDTSVPFTITGGRFQQRGGPAFLNIINYQPLEPGQGNTGEIRLERIRDDLRRWEAYQGGSDPVVLRVYAQPTAAFPVRMPQEFYDGVRELGFWIIRDVYFAGYQGAGAIDDGKAAIDAVIGEVETAGGLDRIFAWEIGNEFVANSAAEIADLETFLAAMRDHVKLRMSEPGREGFSDWVTWATFPPSDLVRTDGNPIHVDLDFYSINAYSYDPERIRDHQAGPVTGTPYAGYLQALTGEVRRQYPGRPVVISETGLPDSPNPAVHPDQPRLAPWYPAYRRGGLTDEQIYEGLVDRYADARLPGLVAGVGFFEWNDEWWKGGNPDAQDHVEEYFGLGRFDAIGGDLRYKLQQEAVHDLFTLDYYAQEPIVTDPAADDPTLAPGGTTTLSVTVDPGAPGPVRYRWESSRGRIVGDSDTVTFHVGNAALGPAVVTVVAIDAEGNADVASTRVDVLPAGGEYDETTAELEIFTLGGGRASGRVANVNLDEYKLAVFIETDQQYPQPYLDTPYVYVGPDGYWWTEATFTAGGELIVWVVPKDFEPMLRPAGSLAPEGTLAEARTTTVNDTDGDLLDDGFETTHFGNLSQDRYGDPDEDLATNLDEFKASRSAQFVAGTNPTVADNDGDSDNLPDNWEYLMFRTLAYGGGDDPDGDGLDNATELTDLDNGPGLGTHPGRTSPDRDRDNLPDRWEMRFFSSLAAGPGDDPNGDGLTFLDDYELGLSPLSAHSFFHTEGRDIVADNPGEKMTFRGVNLTGLEYGSFFDYPYTGDEGTDYSQPWASELVAVADAGLNLVRLPFEWARLVPGWSPADALPAALDADYLAMLDDVVTYAAGQGLYVVLDMHDFLKYWSGQSAQEGVNDSADHQALLARTWELLAAHYAANPAVLGYDLMNEPVREAPGSTNWHAIAQDVVGAIRAVDVNHLIFVEGPNYSLASHWPVDNPTPFITDTVTPGKVVYSPHVYFDYGNDSQYDDPGEDVGPLAGWEYYVRDRLAAALDWSAEHDVPLFFGEMGVPCTVEWAGLLDHAFEQFFDPLEISTAAWQYIDTARWPYLPAPDLNLAECGTLMDVLSNHPGGVYAESSEIAALPFDSLVYGDARVNPWHEGAGSWNGAVVDFDSTAQVHDGARAISVEFVGDFGGVKFVHSFGIDTSRFRNLAFWFYPTSADLDFKLFTTGPLPASAEYPAVYADRPSLSDYVPGGLVAGQWQLVEVPLEDIVDPAAPAITGIAFQDGSHAESVSFYLDEVRLANTDLGTVAARTVSGLNPSVRDLWYVLQAAHDGYLTVEAMPAGGSAEVSLYGPAGVQMAASVPAGAGHRLDWPDAVAGRTYYFKLTGTAAAVDLQAVNLVHHAGTAVTVYGTDGDDRTEVDGSGDYTVTAGGVSYVFTGAEMENVSLRAGLGDDEYAFRADGLAAAIQDAGGNDTLDFSGSARAVTVDLADPNPQTIWAATLLTLDGSVENALGTDFDDVLYGNGAANSLWGGAGADLLAGLGGHDFLDGGDGDDLAIGGPGNDTLYGQMGDDALFGRDGADFLVGHYGNDALRGEEGDDYILGGAGDDSIFGEDGDDLIRGQGWDDLVHGGTGNDTIFGNAGNDRLFGNGGDDVIRGGSEGDFLRGCFGFDIVLGEEGDDRLFGGFHDDIVIGGAGADLVNGESKHDLLIGGNTDFDLNDLALMALLFEWRQLTPIDDRIDHLTGAVPGGRNDPYFLDAATVHDDGELDTLFGEAGRDWFVSDPTDDFADQTGIDR